MNLQKLLTELNHIMSDAEIGKHVGLSQPTIQRVRKGVQKDIMHKKAVSLIELARSLGIT